MGSVLTTPFRIVGINCPIEAPCPKCNRWTKWNSVGGANALAQRYKCEGCGTYSEIVENQLKIEL